MFLAYLGTVTGDERYGDGAEACLARAAEVANRLDPFLFYGVTGIAWAHEHLCGRVLAANDDDLNADTDHLLDGVFDVPGWRQGRAELMYGFSGIGVYLLERPTSATRTHLLDRVVDAIADAAVTTVDGVSWRTFLEPDHILLGMAHGSGGIISFLARLIRETGSQPRAERILRAAVHGVLCAKLPAEGGFPVGVGDHSPARLGWCHGDLGLAVALDAAGRVLGESTWCDEAAAAARRCVARDPGSGTIVDHGLCHGGIGVAHLFHQLHLRLGLPELAAAADRWLAWSFAQRTEDGIAGVRTWSSPDRAWKDDPGLLTGAAGVGLGLLTLAGAIEPTWNRVFGLG